MTLSAGPAPSLGGPIRYRAAIRRFPIALPLSLLVLVTIASAGIAVLRVPVDDDLRGAWRISALLIAVFYFGYIRRTVLTVSDEGVSLRQTFTGWTVAWTDITGAWTTSNLDGTHKGGVAAGLHLKLRTGRVAFIPDLFSIHRRDLAKLVSEQTAVRSVDERLGQARD